MNCTGTFLFLHQVLIWSVQLGVSRRKPVATRPSGMYQYVKSVTNVVGGVRNRLFATCKITNKILTTTFNTTMAVGNDLPTMSSCTTCTFSEDFSNYWTAILYFRARNGTFKRVPQKGNINFESAKGGMTVYYSDPFDGSKVTAFKPGFRMIVGNPTYRTSQQASKFRQLTFTCLQDASTRTGETGNMPTSPCPAGIMSNIRFPTCWDGVNLDSADHSSHVAYPSSGTFESNGPCPATHPVKLPQLFFEVVWDTSKFNDKSLWPTDGSQPFVWSYGDPTGYGTHGDYVFGWKGNTLQTAMDARCNVACPQLKSQSLDAANQCAQASRVSEAIDGWLDALPGTNPVTGVSPGSGTGNGGGSGTPTGGGGGSTGVPSGGQAAHYDQCGGQGYTGPTTCASPYTCKYSNAYYSQCL
ncbi:carbohydrate-binding module family 1 protein [Rutstroemia sp. NJR-2017a BVV2]|nr:carbohydrate-binding module family 1 protein [Rutstroemia sp. NJR-2017a BVV2]